MKRNLPIPVVGQRVWSLNVGNAARHCEQKLTPCVVSRVGRKYFYVKQEGWNLETQYHIDDWREKTDYSASSFLYPSEQEWLDESEEGKLCDHIKNAFQHGDNIHGLPLESLREIYAIINKEPAPNNPNVSERIPNAIIQE